MTIDDLPPTQYLVLEVLAARARTGERVWTFPTTLTEALRRLQHAGLVTVMHGITEYTLRAQLTAKAEAELLDGGYRSPAADGYEQAIRMLVDVAHRTGSPAARWAAGVLDVDPDRVGPARVRGSLTAGIPPAPLSSEQVEGRWRRYTEVPDSSIPAPRGDRHG